ncbi:unnamed protein product [Vitrella brassicaformis CCMP3155]|uniref:F-box domain-containing protein n=1 Tax=Vitrella brassicaformis (strain CCMP3155) TaxID=1169540 RepID=A0A0G4ER66_VITBC|nr:unnamed protein product [Vitrella brassicaformis CCMP3155]|eukprot:CEM00257.1 unnamed protein product [Vitrella brassicaformis CCMP3155]
MRIMQSFTDSQVRDEHYDKIGDADAADADGVSLPCSHPLLGSECHVVLSFLPTVEVLRMAPTCRDLYSKCRGSEAAPSHTHLTMTEPCWRKADLSSQLPLIRCLRHLRSARLSTTAVPCPDDLRRVTEAITPSPAAAVSLELICDKRFAFRFVTEPVSLSPSVRRLRLVLYGCTHTPGRFLPALLESTYPSLAEIDIQTDSLCLTDSLVDGHVASEEPLSPCRRDQWFDVR